MTTKKRNTPKKAAAEPKRYVRVAVKAGKATLQESDRPDRGFKAPRRTKAETIAETISRKLDDLLDGRVPYSATAVGAWTAAPQDDRIVAAYSQADPTPKPRSPIDEAIGRLFAAVSSAECVTDSMVQRLEPITAPQPPGNPTASDGTPCASVVASQLHDIADRIFADSRRRLALLDRLEL